MHYERCPLRVSRQSSVNGLTYGYTCAGGSACLGDNCDIINAVSEITKLKSAIQEIGDKVAALERKV